MVEIPLPSDGYPLVEFTTDIDGDTYTLTLDWSERAERWLFSVNGVVDNQRVEPNAAPLSLAHARPGCPAGELVWLCTQVPGRLDLALTARLAYFTAEEIAAL